MRIAGKMTNIKQTTYKTIADPNAHSPLLGVFVFTGIAAVVVVVGAHCALLAYWVLG